MLVLVSKGPLVVGYVLPLRVHFLKDVAKNLLLGVQRNMCFFNIASCPSSL
jgi:hypothetical protein